MTIDIPFKFLKIVADNEAGRKFHKQENIDLRATTSNFNSTIET